jgi:hypothetical protein
VLLLVGADTKLVIILCCAMLVKDYSSEDNQREFMNLGTTESREWQHQAELQQADHPNRPRHTGPNYVDCFAVNSSTGNRCAAASMKAFEETTATTMWEGRILQVSKSFTNTGPH